jgi:Na+-driven multidrug efflux pump
MLVIGLPAGGELACTFVIMSFIYLIISPFGVAVQAGFGVGSRIVQAVFLPLSALSIAIVPVAGQNFGARKPERVAQSLYSTIVIETVIMLSATLLCQIAPAWLVRLFVDDPAVVNVGAEFLRVVSWTFVTTGVVFSCSGMFQALGNTWPALFTMAVRMVSFVLVAMWLTTRADYSVRHVWYLSVCSVALQAAFSGWLVYREMHKRLSTLIKPVAMA